jgi:rod shape determining protein RodA
MPRQDTIFKRMDYSIFFLYIALVVFGWFNIFSTSYLPENYSFVASNAFKQMIFIGVSFGLAIVVMLIDKSFFISLSVPIYILSLILLVAVLVIGTKISGARSWFQIGGFSFQPSEFAKFATCLVVAKYMSLSSITMDRFSNLFIVVLLLIAPVGLILLQPDMGSAIIFISFLLVMFREGLSIWYLWILLFIIAIFFASLKLNIFIVVGILAVVTIILILINKHSFKNIFLGILLLASASGMSYISSQAFDKLPAHQKDRINILIGNKYDPKGIGYNVDQSKIAIGSGGVVGKGYMQGTQTRFNFVPEQNTDFIFCTIGEEWGFLGSIIILGLFFLLIYRIIVVAERQYDKFTRIYGYCIAGFFFFHVFINIGMVIGILPVIGIPLPFFSYGGSSLICFTLMLFVFLKQDARRINI